MSMYCPKCGSELKEGAVFCTKCGYKLIERHSNSNDQPEEKSASSTIEKEKTQKTIDNSNQNGSESDNASRKETESTLPSDDQKNNEGKPVSSDLVNGEKLKHCPKCGMQVPEDAPFCPKCGYNFRENKVSGIESGPQTENSTKTIATSSNKTITVLIVLVLAALLIGGGGYLYFTRFAPKLNYQKAVKLIDEGKYEEAYNILQKLGDYEDSLYLASTLSEEYDFGNGSGIRLFKDYRCFVDDYERWHFLSGDREVNAYLNYPRQYGTNSGYDNQYVNDQYNFQVKMTGSDVLLIRSAPSTSKMFIYTKANGKNIYWPHGGVFTVNDIYVDKNGYVWYKIDLFGGSSVNASLFEEVNGISLSKMKSIVGSGDTWGCDHYIPSSGKTREYFTELEENVAYIPDHLTIPELKNRLQRYFNQYFYSDVSIMEKGDRVIVNYKIDEADAYSTCVYFLSYRGVECTRFVCSLSEMEAKKKILSEFAEKLILY